MEEKPTTDLVAYDLYLRGKALMDEIATSTDWEGDNRRAIELLDRAVTHDPNFGIAYGLLCEMHLNLYNWVDQTPARLAAAEAALQQAMKIAPKNGETYVARSQFYGESDEWKQSLEMLQLAAKALPNNAKVFNRTALAEERLGLSKEAIRDMEKAKELDPRNPNIPNHLKDMYAGVRDFKKSDEVCEAAIANFPNGPAYYQAQEVANALDRGDVKAARTRLARISAKFDASGYISLLRLEVSLADRNYSEFAQVAANIPREHFIDVMAIRAALAEALVAGQQGDRAKLETLLRPVRSKIEEKLRARPNQSARLADLARIDSYLGRNEEALRESAEAVALKSIAKNAVDGPGRAIARAEILMRAGRHDEAIDLLDQLAKIPYGPSYGDLLGLRWDALRDDPRFQNIVAELASTAKL